MALEHTPAKSRSWTRETPDAVRSTRSAPASRAGPGRRARARGSPAQGFARIAKSHGDLVAGDRRDRRRAPERFDCPGEPLDRPGEDERPVRRGARGVPVEEDKILGVPDRVVGIARGRHRPGAERLREPGASARAGFEAQVVEAALGDVEEARELLDQDHGGRRVGHRRVSRRGAFHGDGAVLGHQEIDQSLGAFRAVVRDVQVRVEPRERCERRADPDGPTAGAGQRPRHVAFQQRRWAEEDLPPISRGGPKDPPMRELQRVPRAVRAGEAADRSLGGEQRFWVGSPYRRSNFSRRSRPARRASLRTMPRLARASMAKGRISMVSPQRGICTRMFAALRGFMRLLALLVGAPWFIACCHPGSDCRCPVWCGPPGPRARSAVRPGSPDSGGCGKARRSSGRRFALRRPAASS